MPVIHDISVWLGFGSHPADINRFRSHTGVPVMGIVPFVTSPHKGRFVVFLKWLFIGYFMFG